MEHRVFTAESRDAIVAIACFEHGPGSINFSVAERSWGSLPARVTRLYGEAIIGSVTFDTAAEILKLAANQWRFDVIRLGEIELNSALYKALEQLPYGLKAIRASRKNAIHWVIELPATFDAFLASLRSSTRSTLKRKIRRFERDCQYDVEVITNCWQVDRFLELGEQISRRTYQWHVGQRLENNAQTRARYSRLAEGGRLRCYLLRIGGQPCAFLRGELSDTLYHYETPGFDPQFEAHSPGVVLLMWAIRDLIENTTCKTFDFGTGGDASGYKASYGNHSKECASIEIFKLYSPYSLTLMSLQQGLSVAKKIVASTIGREFLRRRLKGLLRKYSK